MSGRCVLLDGEGVIWYGGSSIPGAAEAIQKIRSLGYRIIVCTNNASKSANQYLARLQAGGYEGFAESDVITSAVSCGNFLVSKNFNKPGRLVFAIGTQGFVDQLTRVGINVCTIKDYEGQDVNEIELNARIGAVVVGSSEEFDYRTVALATRLVVENDALLISANADGSYPYNRRVLVPGAYALAKCIGTAANREPHVLGKPSEYFATAIDCFDSLNKDETWVVGDRLNTDVKFAKATGLKSILVLTGVSKLEEVALLDNAERPDHVCKDLSEVAVYLANMI